PPVPYPNISRIDYIPDLNELEHLEQVQQDTEAIFKILASECGTIGNPFIRNALRGLSAPYPEPIPGPPQSPPTILDPTPSAPPPDPLSSRDPRLRVRRARRGRRDTDRRPQRGLYHQGDPLGRAASVGEEPLRRPSASIQARRGKPDRPAINDAVRQRPGQSP